MKTWQWIVGGVGAAVAGITFFKLQTRAPASTPPPPAGPLPAINGLVLIDVSKAAIVSPPPGLGPLGVLLSLGLARMSAGQRAEVAALLPPNGVRARVESANQSGVLATTEDPRLGPSAKFRLQAPLDAVHPVPIGPELSVRWFP